ncbi:MAG: hypothetical protein KYX69_00205 [Sphingomonas sp.]|uniref:hypothetical protein n=1 Tax=Sphingomonas sp. TaxID=28214 RepID=UPI00262E7A10|nr:hypothetical protein [Sphingomonas sp.]MDK2766115.1 hypothetical protein [Sphingomonas sp.]
MTHRPALLAPLALLAAALPAMAQEAPAPATPAAKEARIPFPSMIRDFRADGRDAIYLRAGRQWYRGTFFAPCIELPWAWRIGFRPSGGVGGIDRFASIIVPREGECRLASLVRIDGKPPERAKKPAKPKG